MTVEEIRGNMEKYDNFPVGMRVLAVDDDPICLKLLDGLLRKCQYQATTTSHARTALKMLRENRDRFDLVISDVHMPDMDGFKLLELVGLEMDLPVIMLSANSDSRLVMKGITHGACDYLVKPVRLEELKNIWQHVIRKKKVEPKKNRNKSDDQDKAHHQGGGEGERGGSQHADQNGKVNKRRKDEGYESDENGINDDEDPTTQKKPRVVWSIELHKKFVAAVHQLGLEKAVPKRILDLMNVEGLTRENVASHLQKYRLFLKRISSSETHQANMVAALGGKDSAYMRMGSLDGLGGYRTLAGSGRFGGQASLSSHASGGGMLGRLNSPAGVSLHNLASSSPMLQPNNHGQNSSNNALTKLNPNFPPASQNANLFQGIPALLELDQLQQSKCATHVGEFGNNSLSNVSNNPILLQVNSQQPLTGPTGAGFGNQPSINIASFSSEAFNTGVSGSSNFLDHERYNENWQNFMQPLKFHSSSFPLRGNDTSAGPHLQNNPVDISSSTIVSLPFEASRGETQFCETLGGAVQWWPDQNQHYSHNSNNIFGNGGMASLTNPMDQNNDMFCRRVETSLTGRSNGGSSTHVHHSESEKLTHDSRTRTNEDNYRFHITRQQVGFLPQGYGSLDDLTSAMKQEQDVAMLEGGEFGFDAYSLGSGL
ncbi:hypothetical protein RND71_037522 [Anisodus tanguticus]|uniref:Two-component response regulator n=1 Tax=Anisodus tanguticus TaxID=243964 RepID=A0AAE1R3I6_9SOLA|nr:hypothetical protein RND71_037522 [Anisodus tanguticus]